MLGDKDCWGDTGELGGAESVGEVMLYPLLKEELEDEDAGVVVVDPMGFPGFIFATNPASPSIANSAPYQKPFESTDDLATAASLLCPVNLRISTSQFEAFGYILAPASETSLNFHLKDPCEITGAVPHFQLFEVLRCQVAMRYNPRLATRAMLIDQQSRLLLLEGHDSTIANSKHWWFTVGGGLEGEETTMQALHREVLEETGLDISSFAKTPFSRTLSFTFESRSYFQHETYFLARVKTFVPDPSGLTPLERRSIIGYRWWHLDELKCTTETIHPPQLAAWLEYILRTHLEEVETCA